MMSILPCLRLKDAQQGFIGLNDQIGPRRDEFDHSPG